MVPQPIKFVWRYVDVADADGVVDMRLAMVPARGYGRRAIAQFGAEDSEHVLEPVVDRNMRFHNACFAALHDAWMNLPEKVSARWPSEEHFRKWLLCNKSEFFDEKEHMLPNEESAHAFAAHVRLDSPYASIYGPRPTLRGFLVIVRRPRSQAVRNMKPSDFKESMNQILDAAAEFVGVKRGELMKNAGRAA